MNIIHKSKGYLIKNLITGEIDTESQYPVDKVHVDNTPLVEGFAWVEVQLTYMEIGD